MPKTIFKVTDNTGLNAAWEESHVVYIPVASKYEDTPSVYENTKNYAVGDHASNTVSSTTTYYECIKAVDNSGETKIAITDITYWKALGTTWEKQIAVEPTLYLNKKLLEDDSSKFDVNTTDKIIDEGYRAAIYLLELGLPVLVEGVLTTDNGNAPDAEEDPGTITDPNASTNPGKPVFNWTRLEDKNLYDIRFITSGRWDSIIPTLSNGVVTATDATYAKDMNDLAETRKDCVALINISKDLTSAKNIRLCIDTQVDSKDIDWERASAFVPAVKISNTIFKKSDKSLEWVHGTWNYLGAYAYAIRNNPSWYAMAGSFRGVNPDVAEVKVKFNLSDIEVLQARSKTTEVSLDEAGDNIGVAINPIAVINPYGILVWGNRTLKKNEGVDGGTVGVLKASSFLNIENMVATINKRLYVVANKFRFEPNSDILWFNIQSGITPTLDKIKSGNGLLAYKLERVTTTAKARFVVRITLVPIEAVEDFVFEVDLTDFIGQEI